jgi:hypothetical protein
MLAGATLLLRVTVASGAVCQFSFSADGKSFVPSGELFTARQGRWIGAKVGIFTLANAAAKKRGYADFDWFRFE